MADETVDGAGDHVDDEPTVAAGAGDDTGAAPEPIPGEAEPEAQGDDTGVLTDEEFEALQQDPVALRRSVMMARDYTRKTTELARMRDFTKAFESDPRGTIKRMATTFGIKVHEDQAEGGTGASVSAVQSARDQVAAVLGEAAADALVPVFTKIAEEVAAPLRQGLSSVQGQTALTQAEAVVDAFTAQEPEWKKLEPEMVAISKKIKAVPGTDPLEYMRMVHTLASAKTSNADRTRSLVDRVTTSVRGSSSRTVGAPGSRVTERPNRNPTFDEAWSAATRGKRLEY